ncbi:MAG: zinc ribbon domain-containing protein [Oscillospiraceae bacterium]|nr:zinc ribbon domain-containing protein [Oscillospiraceae bacterium]
MKMICPNCGKEYNEKMTCCISCGAELVPLVMDEEQTAFADIIPRTEETEPLPEAVFGGFVRDIPHEPVQAAKEPPKERERRSGRGFFCAAGSFIAAACMFSFIILGAASAALRLATDSGKIAEFAERLDVMSLPAAQTVMLTAEGYEIAPDATLQDAIYVMSQGTGLSREDIKTIYENSTADSFLADRLTEYAEFLRNGELPPKLTAENLKAVFSENLGLIDKTMGMPLSQHDIDLAFAELERAEPVLEAIAPSNIEQAIGGTGLTLLRLVSSVPVIAAEAVLAIAMLAVLWAINRRTARVLGWGGSAVLAGGSAILLTSFFCSVQVFFADCDRFFRDIAKAVTDVIAPDMYLIGGALAVMGTVMLIWAATLRRSRSA